MPNSIAQRIAPFSRLIAYREGTKGSDSGIAGGIVVPLRDKSGFQISRDEVDAPYYNGTAQGWNSAPSLVQAAGALPLGLEFLSSPFFLKMPFGVAGYVRNALVTGSIHNFFPPSAIFTPLSCQLQAEYQETTALYERARYAMIASMAWSYANGGAAPFDISMVANGDVAFTDLGGSKTENGYSGVSVYNGQARLAVAALNPSWFTVQPTAFNATLDTGANRTEAAFNDGVAVAVNPAIPMLKGNLALAQAIGGSTPESDFTFLNYAIQRNLMSYDCLWTDATFGASPFPSAYMRLQIASMRFSRRSNQPGGRDDLKTSQPWMHVFDVTSSKIPAEAFGTLVGTYNIGASTNILSINVDGLGAASVTLTQGAARTATQIVADITADGTIGPRVTADVFMGRVRVTSKQTGGAGSSSSIAFTAAANNANAVLGFGTTTISGVNAPYRISVWNGSNVDQT
jgi:hypothetical protein